MVDTEGMDILASRARDFLRVQVKSSNSYKSDKSGYQWQTNKGGSKQRLTLDDCDIVALVALDIRRIFFLHISELLGNRTKRITREKMLLPDIEKDSWEAALDLVSKH